MTLRIQEGKYYRTRNGRKIGPMQRTSGQHWPWSDGENSYTNHGTYYLDIEGHKLDLIKEWVDEPIRPKLWRDMTPEEKGALLLAHHERKAIQCWAPYAQEWITAAPAWGSNYAYRVRPEPKIETEAVTIVSADGRVIGKGTVVTVDGKPDPASIKMDKPGDDCAKAC